MTHWQKENLLARVLSGVVRIRYRSSTYLVKKPSLESLSIASDVFENTFLRAEKRGLYTEEELLAFLYENNFWDDEKEKLLEEVPTHIEEFKLEMWKSTFQSRTKEEYRKKLRIAERRLAQLRIEKSQYDHLSILGNAIQARAKCLFAHSVCSADGQPLYLKDYHKKSSRLIDRLMDLYLRARSDDRAVRELSHTEPWRSIWCCKKVGEIFNIPAVEFTDDQKTLVGWSVHYDNIFEHPDCPEESVLNDDDTLDGWCVEQKRKRGTTTPNNLPDAQEVGIPVQTREDAERVLNMNSPDAKNIIKQRAKLVREKGTVSHEEFSDVKRQIQMSRNQ